MLYIIGTPIGNLEDISLRALRILSEVDFVLCEDTRVTRKLLDHYKIKTKTVSYHQHSDEAKTEYVLDLLSQGKSLALVSDAGTPGISDPGGKLVEAAVKRFENEEGVKKVVIESVPGPSAVTAALSISGIPTDKFIFMGFPPHKKGRQSFLEKIADSVYPIVVYESKHRIIKFLEELENLNKRIELENKDLEKKIQRSVSNKEQKALSELKRSPLTSVVVCREISKMHETVYRGGLDSIIRRIKENKDDQKGEFVVVMGK
jgi:16S rRNA (cytidine1402-2'-O)-methyltransferase